MTSLFESKLLRDTSRPLSDSAKRLEIMFPNLEWDLKKAGYTVGVTQFLAMVLYLTLLVTTLSFLVVVLPIIFLEGFRQSYGGILFTVIVGTLTFLYLLLIPKVEITKRCRLIDKDLEYMLKDIRIQLSSGVPLFDTMVNIARGQYGECSRIANGIVQEVQSGKDIKDVLDDVGMWSPSEYLRKVLWQIVNAVKSGSDVVLALDAIAMEIRADKENKIKAYGQELNLWGLVYMMVAIIAPSMGVTLLVILSSFLGTTLINEKLFWIIFGGLVLIQWGFISFVGKKRPQV